MRRKLKIIKTKKQMHFEYLRLESISTVFYTFERNPF